MMRIPYNTGGIEFTALLEDIKDYLRQNYKAAHIHRLLKADGKVTMSYGAFCYHLNRLCSEDAPVAKASAKPENRQAAHISPQRQPGIIKTGSAPMQDPRTIDPKTII